jgi:hypothetical protein
MKKKNLLFFITILFATILGGCCSEADKGGYFPIPNEFKEYLDFEENSWWVYNLYTLTNIYDEYEHLSGVDTQITILDTIFLYQKEFIIDTNIHSATQYYLGFCKYDEETSYNEDIKLYFINKKKPMKLGLYYGQAGCDLLDQTMICNHGQVLILNNYFVEIGNSQLFNDFVLFRQNTYEVDKEQGFYNTIFNNLDTLTVEGTLYNNVLENNFDEESPMAGQFLNPSIWLTKEDWIIKLIYKKYDADNTTYILTLIDKNIIK